MKRRKLDEIKIRVQEINRVIEKLYENNAMGKISGEHFGTISTSLENEQSKLKDRISALGSELKRQNQDRGFTKTMPVTRVEALGLN